MTNQIQPASSQYSLSPLAYQAVQTFRHSATFCTSQLQHTLHLTEYRARKISDELLNKQIISKVPQSHAATSGRFAPAAFSWLADTSTKFTVAKDIYNNNTVSLGRINQGDRAVSLREFAQVSKEKPSLPPVANTTEISDFTTEECEWFNELRHDAQGIFTDATLLLLLKMRMTSHKESRPSIQTFRVHVLYGTLKAQDPYKAQYIKSTFLRKEGRNFEAREFNTCDFTYQQCLKMVFGDTAQKVSMASPLTPQTTISQNTKQPTCESHQMIVAPPTTSRVGTSREVFAYENLSPEDKALYNEQAELVNIKTAVDEIVDRARTAKERDLSKASLQADADRAFAKFDANVLSPSLTAMQKIATLHDAITAALSKLEDAIEQHEQPKATIDEIITPPPTSQPVSRRRPSWETKREAVPITPQDEAENKKRLYAQISEVCKNKAKSA